GERGTAWTLDVVGDGGPNPRSDMPGVTYHGPIRSEDRIAEIYAGCDVFVSPATGNESFGIVLLEAMAAGRAIACSDIPGFRFAVGEGRESAAKLFPPTVDGVTRALIELAENPAERARLGKNGRTRVPRFDWEHLVGEVRDEYVAALAVRATALGIRSPAADDATSSPA